MTDTEDQIVYEKQSVSLRRDQIDSIRSIAIADRHKNFSRVVQEAVDLLVERREADIDQKEQAA